MGIFGAKKKSPTEMLRENQRLIKRSIRELDRERTNLQRQETKLTADIKKHAKNGEMGPAKIMAKDLVRTRAYIQKFYRMSAQMQAVSLKMQTMKSNATMAQAMGGVTRAMGQMNRQMNLPAMQRVMMEFEKQSEAMDMKEEMMNDAIDDAMEGDNDEEDEEEVINKVLDEIGVDLTGQFTETPASNPRQTETAPVAAADDDLAARFNNLK
eukprot:TRINITY_DN1641_c0_g1_i2.p1 TRINITY_DN1641_c0_g1~~TRINITY_DN1641_c0_g1_i2.p1  ORF type:complete len:211 (-),score=70.45 TRINITY_DN1641_c0_g1_i2:39-671(-)